MTILCTIGLLLFVLGILIASLLIWLNIVCSEWYKALCEDEEGEV